jgi:hypothetical protein
MTDATFATVRVRCIELVDDQGRPRARLDWKPAPGGPSFALLDARGEAVLILSVRDGLGDGPSVHLMSTPHPDDPDDAVGGDLLLHASSYSGGALHCKGRHGALHVVGGGEVLVEDDHSMSRLVEPDRPRPKRAPRATKPDTPRAKTAKGGGPAKRSTRPKKPR